VPQPDPTVVTPAVLRAWPLPGPAPGAEGDKETRGSVVVLGGAVRTPGAVLLAGTGALRAGAGKLQVAAAAAVATALADALPEASVVGLPTAESGTVGADAVGAVLELTRNAAAVLVGPGLSDPEETRRLVAGLLTGLPAGVTVVLDALGCSCGAATLAALRRFEGRVVLTPNPAEMAHLLGGGAAAELHGVTGG